MILALAAAACAKAGVDAGAPINQTGGNNATGGSGGTSVLPGFGGAAIPPIVSCANDLCEDFPAAPIVEPGAEGVPAMFKDPPGAGAGPCVVEPEDGSLFPANWLRPRFRWQGAAGPTEIRISSPKQKNDLVVYTSGSEWKMPKEMWRQLAAHLRGQDLAVAVRSTSGVTKLKFSIALVEAAGSMVFWAAKPAEVGKDPAAAGVENDSELRGFAVGDESTASALRIPQVEQPSRDQGGNNRTVKCIGCHTATPDGAFVAFTDHWPWNSAIAGVKPEVAGKPLPELSMGGLTALNRPWGGMMTFSPLHWRAGDRLMVIGSSLKDPKQPWITANREQAELVWYDLEAPAPADVRFSEAGKQFGVIARTGDTGGAAAPDWSLKSDRIVYASTRGGNLDGRLEMGATDLYIVPFNNRQGGAAKPVAGASDPAFEEYYPAWSPDEELIAFNRVPAGQRMYANPAAELFVASTRVEGQAVRLTANDPPACSGKKSPGINNHWAQWSPVVQPAGASTYYWIIFSSNRSDIPPVQSNYKNPGMPGGSLVEVSQLYITAVVVNESGIQSYPAIYLWNQPTDTLNTTPAWEVFQLPPID